MDRSEIVLIGEQQREFLGYATVWLNDPKTIETYAKRAAVLKKITEIRSAIDTAALLSPRRIKYYFNAHMLQKKYYAHHLETEHQLLPLKGMRCYHTEFLVNADLPNNRQYRGKLQSASARNNPIEPFITPLKNLYAMINNGLHAVENALYQLRKAAEFPDILNHRKHLRNPDSSINVSMNVGNAQSFAELMVSLNNVNQHVCAMSQSAAKLQKTLSSTGLPSITYNEEELKFWVRRIFKQRFNEALGRLISEEEINYLFQQLNATRNSLTSLQSDVAGRVSEHTDIEETRGKNISSLRNAAHRFYAEYEIHGRSLDSIFEDTVKSVLPNPEEEKEILKFDYKNILTGIAIGAAVTLTSLGYAFYKVSQNESANDNGSQQKTRITENKTSDKSVLLRPRCHGNAQAIQSFGHQNLT